MGIKILATGKAVPANAVTNEQLSAFLDTNDEWISSRTGIRSRYIAHEEGLGELCERAAREALARSGTAAEDIDMIICSTIRGDYLLPSLACCVSEKLGASCPAFDINAACSGFIYALDVADGFISTGKAERILLVCAEMMSRMVDWTDRSTCVLFGDGAAACVIGAGDAVKYLRLTAAGNTKFLYMEGSNGNSPYLPAKSGDFIHMQGQDVFKFAVSMINQQIDAALRTLGIGANDIDCYLIHQANKRIIDTARSRLGQPEEKFPTNIERYGNISSVSVPLLLDELLEEGRIKAGDRLLLSAFGAGMTTGTAVIEWQ